MSCNLPYILPTTFTVFVCPKMMKNNDHTKTKKGEKAAFLSPPFVCQQGIIGLSQRFFHHCLQP